MKRILLHLGLPKTATTTLQHHLFQKLHDEGNINFLGKVVDYDKNGKAYFKNNVGWIIRKACEGRINNGDVSEKIDELLVKDKLNVFSDEGIMVFYPGQDNLPLSEKIQNLNDLLSEFEVKVLMTIRQPVDYIFSLYVQLHAEFYRKIKELDTFEKYAHYFVNSESNIDQESVFMEETIKLVSNYFDTKILVFEDIKHDPKYFAQQVALALETDKHLVEKIILDQHENIKKGGEGGVYSQQVISLLGLKKWIADVTRKQPIVHSIFKSMYRSEKLPLQQLTNFKVAQKATFHKKADPILSSKLLSMTGISPSFQADKFGVSQKKLCDYNYIAGEVINAK
ncbi:hypothetical protein Q7A_1090 [Methylophaga nitratireducenticrescens]|uniref:Sulfotransferase domain-containing protein n=1 Tax=Methylophaga nitratireducenticrescens TaxID=754476 RepID=I1XHR1_METNJ|nr:hypothetical protein [Methylophaga nitratireducenticrescens]AFI83930.1 hypothetical protein Q7A_1090 [Methylophaga nitratireducenticrescens]